MSEMVKRIAQAMCREKGQDADAPLLMADGRSYGPPRWQENVSIAIAVIAAMCDPTEEMLRVGLKAVVAEPHADPADTCWRAMIDAALA